MKKILSIALVAVLAVSTAFAAFSGAAKVEFGYNPRTGEFGLTNGSDLSLNLDLATADGAAKGEGDIYAGVDASLALKLARVRGDKVYGNELDWARRQASNQANGLGLIFKFNEAYIAGDGWKLSILGTSGTPDFAKSAIDTKKDVVRDTFGNIYDVKNTAVSYKVGAWDGKTGDDAYQTSHGVQLTIADYAIGAGFYRSGVNANTDAVGDNNNMINYNVYFATPSYAFGDSVSAKFAGIVANPGTDKKGMNVGASAEVAFDADVVSGKVAADFGFENIAVDGKDVEFKMDAAAALAISPVTLDVYYATKVEKASKYGIESWTGTLLSNKTPVIRENMLSVGVGFDLNAFDVPVTFKFTGKDLVKVQDMKLTAKFALDALSFDVYGGWKLNGDANDVVSAGASVEYKADLFTVGGGLDWSTELDGNDVVLAANASISTSALIPGAVLALEYGAEEDYIDMNFLKDQDTKQNFGAVTASCKIAF